MNMDELVEAGAKAHWNGLLEPGETPWSDLPEHVRQGEREHARAILAAVLPLVLKGPVEALEPFTKWTGRATQGMKLERVMLNTTPVALRRVRAEHARLKALIGA